MRSNIVDIMSPIAVVLSLMLLDAGLVLGQSSGRGLARTLRGWDCCKVSCAWEANTDAVSSPVRACDASGTTAVSEGAQSGCNVGRAYLCNDQQPFVGPDGQAYGFAAAHIIGLEKHPTCCSCYRLTFTDTAAQGQVLTVQVTNTGADLDANEFILQIPGGGFGYFTEGCPRQWGIPAANWGATYGGVSSREQCSALPQELQHGCRFRFDWFKGADNPNAFFERVPCPSVLTDISQCRRNDD